MKNLYILAPILAAAQDCSVTCMTDCFNAFAEQNGEPTFGNGCFTEVCHCSEFVANQLHEYTQRVIEFAENKVQDFEGLNLHGDWQEKATDAGQEFVHNHEKVDEAIQTWEGMTKEEKEAAAQEAASHFTCPHKQAKCKKACWETWGECFVKCDSIWANYDDYASEDKPVKQVYDECTSECSGHFNEVK